MDPRTPARTHRHISWKSKSVVMLAQMMAASTAMGTYFRRPVAATRTTPTKAEAMMLAKGVRAPICRSVLGVRERAGGMRGRGVQSRSAPCPHPLAKPTQRTSLLSAVRENPPPGG